MRIAVVLRVLLVAVSIGSPPRMPAQSRVDSNVVYGMYSGLALLLDVHYPASPNGYAVLYIPGNGWHLPLGYASISLKGLAMPAHLRPVLEAGYTVFAINHRAAPRFHYPAALEDAERAVRFIRFHAERFGINPERIGGWGFSSGAHLVALLGVLDGAGTPGDPDAINRHSAKLQCIVAGALPADLTRARGPLAPVVTSFLGAPHFTIGPSWLESRFSEDVARQASPLYQVSADDAPFLLEHGDADQVVPFDQSVWMDSTLRRAGVPVVLRRVPGGDHGGPAWAAHDTPVRYAAIVAWFDRHLRGTR